MKFWGKRSLKPSALSRARKIKGYSKRDVAILKRHASSMLDSNSEHGSFTLLSFHRRRRRSRWLNAETGGITELHPIKSFLAFKRKMGIKT